MRYLLVSQKDDPAFFQYIISVAQFHQTINGMKDFPLKITGPESNRKVRILSNEYPMLHSAFLESQHGKG